MIICMRNLGVASRSKKGAEMSVVSVAARHPPRHGHFGGQPPIPLLGCEGFGGKGREVGSRGEG